MWRPLSLDFWAWWYTDVKYSYLAVEQAYTPFSGLKHAFYDHERTTSMNIAKNTVAWMVFFT